MPLVAGFLRPWSCMHHDERVNESIAVVVIRREIHVRVRQHGGVSRHRPGVRFGIVRAGLPARIRGKRSRKPVRADDFAVERQQSVR